MPTTQCTACGKIVPDNANFCPACGRSLSNKIVIVRGQKNRFAVAFASLLIGAALIAIIMLSVAWIVHRAAEHGAAIFDEPGEFSWSVPDGVHLVWISAAAAGGGGGGGGVNYEIPEQIDAGLMRCGAGGGGGAAFIKR